MAIIQAPGGGWELLVETLLRKEQLAQTKEEQKLRKADFEMRMQEAQANQQRQQDAIAGAQAAAQLLLMQRPDLGPAMDQLAPSALPSFLENLQGFQMGQEQLTGARLGNVVQGSNARVATGTEAARIADANLAPEVTRAQLMKTYADTQGVNLNNALMEAKRTNDPQRVGLMFSMMERGVDAETAAQAAGVTNNPFPEGFQLPLEVGAAGAGGEQAQRAASLYTVMKASSSTIDQLIDAGVDINLWGSLNRSSKRAFTQWLTGLPLGDDQRRLINAQKQFSDMYRLFVSGQQSAVTEAERILFTIMENPNDGPDVINQKRFMRSLVVGMVEDVASGRISSEQAAQSIYDAAVAQGLPEDQINIFREQLEEARMYTALGGPFANRLASGAPTTAETLPNSLDWVDALIDDTLGPSGN